jgi:hypothetical protein
MYETNAIVESLKGITCLPVLILTSDRGVAAAAFAYKTPRQPAISIMLIQYSTCRKIFYSTLVTLKPWGCT